MSDAWQDAPHTRSNQYNRTEVSHTNVCEQSEIDNLFMMKRQFVGFASGLIFFVSFSIKRKSDPSGAFIFYIWVNLVKLRKQWKTKK